MGWAGVSRGAPRRIVGDDNDIFSPRIDVKRRAAWLLRMSRIATPWGNRPAAGFVRRLHEVGLPEVHSSRVTSWEGGTLPVDISLVAGYERALGLHPGRLQGPIVAMLLATDPQAQLTSVPPLERSKLFAVQNQVVERIEAGVGSGGDWLTLAGLLTAPTAVPPPAHIIENWINALFVEFVRSVHDDYTARWGTLASLVADPLLAPIVREQAMVVAREPGVPFARLIWDVLSQDVDASEYQNYMQGLLSSDSERQIGVSFGVATMLSRRQLSKSDVTALVEIVRQMAVASPEQRELAFMFAARLGGGVPALVGMPMRITEATLRLDLIKPAHLGGYVRRAREDAGIHDDPMIVRLLQEGLSHHFVDKRQVAHQLIAASPYRESVASHATKIAASAALAEDRVTAALLLRQMAPADLTSVYRLLESPDPVVVNHALIAIARAGGDPPDDLERLLRDPLTREGAVLTSIYARRPIVDASPAEQARERWWSRHGGTIASRAEAISELADPKAG